MIKTAVAALMLVAFTSPVLAEDTYYYVVQDVKTKKCTITHEKPTTTTESVIVGDSGVTYKTETEAQTGMKTVKVCTEQ